LNNFFFMLYVISLVVMADTHLKAHPASRKFLAGLEDGTVSVLRWRAESDVAHDMIGIKKILLMSTVIFFVVAFIMMANQVRPNIYFSSIFLINLLLFTSIQWFLDFKRETLKMMGFLLIVVASPWLLYLLGESANIQPGFADIFRTQFNAMGLTPETDYQVLTDLSIALFFGSAMMLGSWIIMLTVPSILLLWSIKGLNKVSFILVNLERRNVRLFFVAVNILVPVWFFIKD